MSPNPQNLRVLKDPSGQRLIKHFEIRILNVKKNGIGHISRHRDVVVTYMKGPDLLFRKLARGAATGFGIPRAVPIRRR
jgi:hypothetical protein